MKLDIVARSFAQVDGKAVELEEYRAQHPDSTPRHWSSCCAFLPSPDPEGYATQLRGVIKQQYVEVIPASAPESGVWLRGPHYQLAAAIEALGMGWAGA